MDGLDKAKVIDNIEHSYEIEILFDMINVEHLL